MRALVKYKRGGGSLELQDVSIPEIVSDEVLVEVKACGICGTDIHIMHDEFKNTPPVILGHEFSGRIVKLGKDVNGWKTGDRIVSELHTGSCRKCRVCRAGNYHICPKKRPVGS